MSECVIGVLGGSGVYEIEGLTDVSWQAVHTPFGAPSDDLCLGVLDGVRMAFLPRHGRGHPVPPGDINYLANIDALKRVGVTDVISVSAVGSLKEDMAPGDFVIVDQFIDRTFARTKTFFGPGLVAHVSMADPICPALATHCRMAAEQIGVKTHWGGTYLAMEGPQFSTRAESELYRSWGCSVIGMTNMPEAKLAREAELSYATVAMVTDYDCWHDDHDAVTVDQIIAVLLQNADNARALVKAAVPMIAADSSLADAPAKTALEAAVITAPEMRDPAMMRKLDAVAGRVLRR
ncbi:MAG: S-methyl-5'-thioadenosine phosphorylase [Pseudomonadota bacterium]